MSDHVDETRSPEAAAPPAPRRSSPVRKLLVVFCNLILPPLLIFGGILAYQHLMATGPVAEKKRPPRRAVLVEVAPVQPTVAHAVVEAMGTVLPAREVALRPRVSGAIRDYDPRLIPGARFQAGEVLFQIDPTDYELTVARRESELAKARADLEIEMGNQRIARRELELLGEGVDAADRALLLREPQLRIIQASIQSAEVALSEAENDVERTVIRAPFNCIVRQRMVDVGAQVSPSTTLAELVGTDEYWVELLLPVDRLAHLDGAGAAGTDGGTNGAGDAGPGGLVARVYDRTAWGDGVFRTGRVLGLIGSLETAGRMARLLVAVTDPLGIDTARGHPDLLLGSYLRAEIDGNSLGEVAAIQPEWLRGEDQVWILDPDDRLEVRRARVVYRRPGKVFVGEGLAPGDRIVTSDLAAPVPGMPLRLATDSGAAPATAAAPEEAR